ncbi:tigger transposable element-derived protein 4-like [Ischnura elegans]|uniref:tigger transposable element-derived protein 4-like n=1 Tax=Ischnura elegans TaxID=197161 RepID=UPI001ED8A53C|nr:tigger transposable element-derived protein 4-like [Ischnura elegans]
MAKPPAKRQISTFEKLKILRVVDENPHMKRVAIAARLQLPPSTLFTIIKNRERYERFAKLGIRKGRKKVGSGKFKQLKDTSTKWCKTRESSVVPLNGAVVRGKDPDLVSGEGISDFTASNGWIHNFKKRYGWNDDGEPALGDTVWETWKDITLPGLIKDYSPNDVFNVSEMGIFFNFLPSEILSLKGGKCREGNTSDERLTVLLGCNESGTEKLMPLVVGNYKPESFKTAKEFPCMYEYDPDAWMTTSIFVKFLRMLDIKMGGQNRRILMLIDNCAAHPVDYGFLNNVTVVFFPPECSIVLQPLDQGILRCVKHKYRELVVNERLGNFQRRKVSVLDALNFVKYAWDSVKPSAIRFCFHSSGFYRNSNEVDTEFSSDEETGEQSVEVWDQLLEGEGMTFEEFVSCDDDLEVCRSMQMDKDYGKGQSYDADKAGQKSPTFEEAIDAMETVRRFVTSHKVDGSVMNALIKLYSTIKVLGVANGK